jgi:hypothetical protein
MYYFYKKMCLATFWAIFSQTHLVTLASESARRTGRRTAVAKLLANSSEQEKSGFEKSRNLKLSEKRDVAQPREL